METPKPLPASTQLARSHPVTYQGKSYKGPLVADGGGLAVDIEIGHTRSGLKKIPVMHRVYLQAWSHVTEHTIGPASPKQLGGSTVNSHSVLLTLTSASGAQAFILHFTDVPQVTSIVSPLIAKAKATAAARAAKTQTP
jgi:hypothetical protein